MMLSNVLLLRLGVESERSNFNSEIIQSSSRKLLQRTDYLRMLELVEQASLDSSNDTESLLRHASVGTQQEYRKLVKQAVNLWEESIERTRVHHLAKADDAFAKPIFLTRAIVEICSNATAYSCSKLIQLASWDHELAHGTVLALNCVLEV